MTDYVAGTTAERRHQGKQPHCPENILMLTGLYLAYLLMTLLTDPYFRNHARLIFTYILCARITDYLETHL